MIINGHIYYWAIESSSSLKAASALAWHINSIESSLDTLSRNKLFGKYEGPDHSHCRGKYYSKSARDNQKPDFSKPKKIGIESALRLPSTTPVTYALSILFPSIAGEPPRTALLLMGHNGFYRPRFCCYCGCGHKIDCIPLSQVFQVTQGGARQVFCPFYSLFFSGPCSSRLSGSKL